MMSAAPRYLFDRSFEPGRETPAPQAVILARIESDHRAALETARREAFAHGEAKGRESASAETEAEIARALEAVFSASADLAAEAERHAHRLKTESAALALTAASRLAAELVRRAPEAEIEALFRDCLSHLDGSPHLTLRVPAKIAAGLEARVRGVAAEKGFTGNIAVLAEAGMHPGDCRIEWADGGASRDWRKLLASVEDAVKRHLNTGPSSASRETGAAA